MHQRQPETFSLSDIRANDLHIHTSLLNEQEVLYITSKTPRGTGIQETLKAFPLGFYLTNTYSFHRDTDKHVQSHRYGIED